MKRIFSIIAALGCILSVASCSDEMPSGADLSSLRVALTPEPGVIPADGAVAACAVTVHEGANLGVDWDVSVDFAPEWVKVEKIDYDTEYSGVYEGDDRQLSVPGIRITVDENLSGVKRNAYLRFFVKDGGSVTYQISQSK